MPTVLVSQLEGASDLIRERFPDVNVVECKDDDALLENAAIADVLLAWRAPPEFFERARRLRWFQTIYVGVDWMLPMRAQIGDVSITNVRGIAADMIADYVITGIGLLHWDFPRRFREQARREWKTGEVPRLAGKTVGIVGLGAIGMAIAWRCKGADLRVIGTKRDTTRPVENVDQLLPADRLRDLLEASDFVVLAVPFTPETNGMIAREQLSRMRRSAYLVNIARGSIVVEPDLVDALREGTIAGALLDVAKKEPLPAESPLWTAPNAIITPHISGWLPDYTQHVLGEFAENMTKFLAEQPLANVIDLRRGY